MSYNIICRRSSLGHWASNHKSFFPGPEQTTINPTQNDPGPPNFYTTPSASRQPSQESGGKKLIVLSKDSNKTFSSKTMRSQTQWPLVNLRSIAENWRRVQTMVMTSSLMISHRLVEWLVWHKCMTKHPTTAFLEVSPKSILSNFRELFLSKVGTSQESAAGDRTLNRCSYITANKRNLTSGRRIDTTISSHMTAAE